MTEAGRLRRNVYIVSFLYSIQFGLLIYFNSAFLLDRGFSEKDIGIVFASGYAIAICLLLLIPRLLPLFGNRKLFTAGLIGAGVLFFAISATSGLAPVAIMLPAALALSMAMYVLLDIFLQTASADPNKIGGRRGLVSTLLNGAYILAQFLAIFLLARGPFSLLYAVTAAMLVPLAGVAYLLFRRFRDAVYTKPVRGSVLWHLRSSADLRNIFITQFLLRLFYSVMVVYTPIYLHEHVGLSLTEMGIAFAVMLLPFLLFEVLIGRLEDTRWGEQEVLLAGFVVIALSTAAIAVVDSTSVIIWSVMLFVTRIGAVCLDVGSEAYFFKHVRGSDSGEMSSFRMLYPIAYIVGPLTATALLYVIPINFLFIALGAAMLLGVFPTRALRDTR